MAADRVTEQYPAKEKLLSSVALMILEKVKKPNFSNVNIMTS